MIFLHDSVCLSKTRICKGTSNKGDQSSIRGRKKRISRSQCNGHFSSVASTVTKIPGMQHDRASFLCRAGQSAMCSL
ncbi:hypothetical protein PUN28_017418 [Cardiocondyla obscurior]|uniref:Uncharacterized protein n=1 Tax=Cardiocondyla obscurior TaxID=286306 RepID=A0AAW2EMY7_9HYME